MAMKEEVKDRRKELIRVGLSTSVSASSRV